MVMYMKKFTVFCLIIALTAGFANAQINSPDDDPLRVIAIFAHPDDGDIKMGGTAAMLAEMGH